MVNEKTHPPPDLPLEGGGTWKPEVFQGDLRQARRRIASV